MMGKLGVFSEYHSFFFPRRSSNVQKPAHLRAIEVGRATRAYDVAAHARWDGPRDGFRHVDLVAYRYHMRRLRPLGGNNAASGWDRVSGFTSIIEYDISYWPNFLTANPIVCTAQTYRRAVCKKQIKTPSDMMAYG